MSVFDDTGLTIDRYDAVRTRMVAAIRTMFGDGAAAAALDEDTIFGKLATSWAEIIADQNEMIEFVSDSYDPQNSSGQQLKKLVLLNGLTANEGLYSTVSLTVGANAYGATLIAGDQVSDPNRPTIKYALDSGVVISPSSSATVSATCTTIGANTAAAGTITQIDTPRLGWSTVTNAAAAVPGQNEETSSQLRRRRHEASRRYGISTLKGVWSALADLDTVDEVFVHQNLGTTIDAFGVPARNLWAIVSGGTDAEIAQTLFETAPLQTFGASSDTYEYEGHEYTMYFDRPVDTAILVELTFSPVSPNAPAGWPVDGEATVAAAVEEWAAENQKMSVDAIPDAIAAGASVVPGWYVSSCEIGESAPLGTSTITVGINERITIDADDVTVSFS